MTSATGTASCSGIDQRSSAVKAPIGYWIDRPKLRPRLSNTAARNPRERKIALVADLQPVDLGDRLDLADDLVELRLRFQDVSQRIAEAGRPTP
jgi:hypothetical protein